MYSFSSVVLLTHGQTSQIYDCVCLGQLLKRFAAALESAHQAKISGLRTTQSLSGVVAEKKRANRKMHHWKVANGTYKRNEIVSSLL